ncbi:MAG: PAS domain S-box protein [Sandaracinaceae bacterium]|nr:PAS domain S-box protein [Sandaracinaceae bacterium]
MLHRDAVFERALGRPAPVGSRLADAAPWLASLSVTEPSTLTSPDGVEVEISPTGLADTAAVARAWRPTAAGDLERELRIARGTLSSLLEAAPVSILVLDLEQRVTIWNQAAARIFGWTAEEIVGSPYPLVPQGEADTFHQLFQRVIRGEGFTGVEAPRQRKDGSTVHLRIHTAPMRDAEGEVVGAMAILEDLTERHLLEAQVRQSERLEAVGRLAGGIAHDFNNLLMVILGICEVLQRANVPEDRIADGITQIRECGEHARSLTAQLLAFSRRQVLHPEVVDISERVQATAGLLARLIGERIEMTLELADTPLFIRVDTSQFDQMLVNLVVNARDAMREGGRLVVRTALEPRTPEGEACARLEVADDGLGVAADVLPLIFDPFFTTKRPGQGTGLGLATVHGIVEQSGGRIRVESVEGHGSTFRVWLPLVEAAPEPARTPAPTTDHPRGCEVVLLVEDDPQVRLVASRMLGTLGYEVHAAADGPEALMVLDAGLEASLLITDLAMPRMGGLELVRRARERGHALPVVYVSANLDDDELRAQVDSGAASFLQKPFTMAALATALRARLD